MSITIACTGHRPKKLTIGDLNAYDPIVYDRLVDLAKNALVKYDVERVFTGMALGWDQAVAEAAAGLGLPFYAFIPFEGFEAPWPYEAKKRYFELLDVATARRVVSKPGYAAWKLQRRNEALIDSLPEKDSMVFALFDGEPHGGTFNCLRYAQTRQRNIVNLWPSWQRHANQLFLTEDAAV